MSYDAGRIAPPKARVYLTGNAHDYPGEVAEMHLSFGAVAQVSVTPDNAGFLIRVWPAQGTHEYGGNNATVLSAVVTYDAALKATVTSFDMREETP